MSKSTLNTSSEGMSPKRLSTPFVAWLSSDRVEPWRDWAALLAIVHALLLTAAVGQLSWPWLLALAVPLGLVLATATLTVLHDAGHRRFSRREWPNVVAVQTAIPAGLWVAHWTLKHRVHHRDTQLYPTDEATRSSGLIRLHPSAARRPVHRFQHYYAWLLYGIAWMGEIRSQLTYLCTGEIAGTKTPSGLKRTQSFVTEKALCLLVLLPYAVMLGIGPLALLLIAALTVASVAAAVVLVVGHIN
ncbi:MAG: fatty acid desaturase, partial [Thermoleophilaceae bacterium]|nr:fatty acid desaturase [Thermoleophilaceae bacterium]